MATLVSVYELVSDTSNVVRSLKARGFDDLTTYSPAPFPELEEAEDPTPSKVRVLTLIGGLVGVSCGAAVLFSSIGTGRAARGPSGLVVAGTAIVFAGLAAGFGALVGFEHNGTTALA